MSNLQLLLHSSFAAQPLRATWRAFLQGRQVAQQARRAPDPIVLHVLQTTVQGGARIAPLWRPVVLAWLLATWRAKWN